MCNVLDGNEIIIQIESIKLNFKLNMSLIKELVRINFGPLGHTCNIYLQYFIKFSKIATKKREKKVGKEKRYTIVDI